MHDDTEADDNDGQPRRAPCYDWLVKSPKPDTREPTWPGSAFCLWENRPMPAKATPILTCLICKERIAEDEPYILDMWARAWCESCVIEYLGQYEPRGRIE